MLKLKIWWLKRRARKIAYKLNALRGRYNCGIDMINQITGGEFTRLGGELAEIKGTLSKIDPNFPKAKA